ncbi:MAG: hypothetical protein AAFN77_10215 [Planctomycetota bacterium]
MTTCYEALESRQLLAALVSYNAGSGELSIDLTDNNDAAIVDVSAGNISVNGSIDLDSSSGGVLTAAADDIRRITVNGDVTKANQRVELNGDMSNVAGRDLTTVTIDAVNRVDIAGDYQLSNRLDVRLVGTGGEINDGDTGRIRVAGETDIRANRNDIVLNNGNNDFAGPVLVSNTEGASIVFADENDFVLASVFASGDLQVFSVGNISDSTDATISVDGVGRFNGASVNFGNDVGDTINFGSFQAISTGDVFLSESSNVVLTNVDAQNLTITTSEGIFDSRLSNIDVEQLATFNGTSRIRIGENGTDTFNAGSVNFNSVGHVHIWEDSGTSIVGSNTAASMNLYSTGDITDADTASINVEMISGFEAENVLLGDTETDEFNTGSLYFYTPGDFNVSENSSTQITETKNEAQRLFLTSTGAITDAVTARTNVQLLAQFTADSVNIGDQVTDEFNAGSVTFDTVGQFQFSEDSATNIVGNNSAGNIGVTSVGDITNVYNVDGNGATITVDTVASFSGANIDLGNEVNDTLNFDALQFNSVGDVSIAEDSDMVLTLANTANSAILQSTGTIEDVSTALINVVSVTQFVGTSVTIGDFETDQFNAGTLSVQSAGAVFITENSDLVLTGTNRAAAMTLVSSGNIIDAPEADTVVTGNLNLTGSLLNLGNEATDVLTFGSLTFDSTGNTNVTSDSDIELRGNSQTGDILLLTATGNITDFEQARTEVVTRAIFEGVDVIIGDLADDCFDILNGGAANLFVTSTGTNDVTVDCPE